MKLSNSIRALLITFLNNKIVVASWGIHDVCIAENSISFHVDAFKYNGCITIVAEEPQGYVVAIAVHKFTLSLEDVIYTIDSFIEQTENYGETLGNWIQTQK